MSEHDTRAGFLEPSLEFLVATLRMQAEMQMGLFRMSEDDDAEPNLPMARHFIDLIAMLLEKTKGNLSLEENRMIENTVTELRFRFVQVTQSKPAAAEQEKRVEAEEKQAEVEEKQAEPDKAAHEKAE